MRRLFRFRSYRWCESHSRKAHSSASVAGAGEVSGAFRAYVRAEQWAAVRRLLHVRGADVVAKPLGSAAKRIPFSLSSEDPWLVLANARRLLRHGTLARAVAAYRKAESLTTDLEVAALCRLERRNQCAGHVYPGCARHRIARALGGCCQAPMASAWPSSSSGAANPRRPAARSSSIPGPRG